MLPNLETSLVLQLPGRGAPVNSIVLKIPS